MDSLRPPESDELIGTAAAADLLGVRVQTVYAYVSRGLLTRVDGTTRHTGSAFRLRDVRDLAGRHRRPRTGTFELVIAAVDSLGADDAAPAARTIADRMWRALAQRAARAGELQTLQAAMVLLADHELATSTVAARAAASTGARLCDAVGAGLSAMSGPRHGAASLRAAAVLARATRRGARGALDEMDGIPPGFGHPVYRDVDPRAEHLLDRLSRLNPSSVALVDDLALEAYRRHQVIPNVDLALAALVHDLELRPGSGEVIFMVARMAGLAAHVMEEWGRPMRFRPRAVYTGASG